MKKILYSLSIIIILLTSIISSCTKDFDEINMNPNNPDVAPLEGVLAYSIINLANRFDINTEMEYAASYAGYVTMSLNNDAQRYLSNPPSGIWSSHYISSLPNLNSVIKDASDAEVNFKAAAIVLKVYATQLTVDAYGTVPYFEASQKSEGINQPKFDSEEEIYNDLLNQLEIANTLFDATSKKLSAADVIYGGSNILYWKKFANSLRLRIAIRMSNVDQAKATSEITKILSNTAQYPIFESNADNAILKYPGDNWKDPWTNRYDYEPYIRIAAPIVDTLKLLADPRLSRYAELNSNSEYIGLQVGLDGVGNESEVNYQFVNNPTDGKVYFMTYSEVEFIKAEAYARGLSGSVDAAAANTAYQNAISANMQMLGINTTDINSYLAQPSVAYNNNLKKIYIQKWISLFRQSWEAWAEMRRTDVPQLPVANNSHYTGHNRVPFRFDYPQSEKDLNSNTPNNLITDFYWGTQIWWDTRTGVN